MAVEILNYGIISFHTDLFIVSSSMDFLFFRRLFFLLCKISIFVGFIRIIFTCDLFALFHNFSETWLTMCDWSARLPALDSFIILEHRTGNTKVFMAFSTSIFYIVKTRGATLFFFTRHFLKFSLLHMATTQKQARLWKKLLMYA